MESIHDMTVIINIQTMSKMIHGTMNSESNEPALKAHRFAELDKRTSEELRTIQDELIPYYNHVIEEGKVCRKIDTNGIYEAMRRC